jgi:hypothetical protein
MSTRLAAAVAATNHVRWGPTPAAKEWFHFCALTPDVQVLVNLSLSDEPDGARGRVLALARVGDEPGWRGGERTHHGDSIRAVAGGHRVAIGEAAIDWRDGRYFVAARAGAGEDLVEVDLELSPLTVPLVAERVDLAPGSLGWVAVPRLVASGAVRAAGRIHRVDRAPAYHDHNWGAWRWGGGDFAWQWGFALAPAHAAPPWAVLYSRLTDRARSRAFDTKVSVWRGALLERVFSAGDVRVRAEGRPPVGQLRRIPRVMNLVIPGDTVEAPGTLEVTAARDQDHDRDRDWLTLRYRPEAVAQVAIPNHQDLGFTLIDETSGRFAVKGRIDGVDLGFEGRSMFEFTCSEP